MCVRVCVGVITQIMSTIYTTHKSLLRKDFSKAYLLHAYTKSCSGVTFTHST